MAVSVGFHFSRFGQFQMRWPCAAPSVASDGNERCRGLVLAPTVSPQLWQISLSLRVPFSIASSRSWRKHGGSERQRAVGLQSEREGGHLLLFVEVLVVIDGNKQRADALCTCGAETSVGSPAHLHENE